MDVLNCGGQLLDLTSPKVMAICNINNDSFYAQSRVNQKDTLIQKVKEYLSEGAAIIDIGGMSSRPGAIEIPEQEEIDRLCWALEIIRGEYGEISVSIDTYRAKVVDAAMEYKVQMVNDISGGALDPQLWGTVARYNLPYVLMHMKGTPENMQVEPHYRAGVVMDLLNFFKNRLNECRATGVQQIIIDPGFGFGKTVEDNYALLKGMDAFKLFGLPLLVGLSRKSMIYKLLDSDANRALNGTSICHMLALQKGVKILRVHDVKEAAECIKIYELYDAV